MSSLVIVARFSSRPEAVVAQSVLQSAGIETLLPEFNVLMAELDPSMMEHGWRLMASEDDVETARSILAEAQQHGG
jgi:Putative prokaryotic signal transducing protein